jgi:YhcH/YjgK/YiaL family protein
MKQDFSKLVPGEHEVKGRTIYASVSYYDTKQLSEGSFEAHVKYIDIQFVISGEERIGYAPMAEHPIYMREYDYDKDYALFETTGELLVANQKVFFIFMPQDVHMPGIQLHGSHPVKKLVMKIEKDF